MLTLESVTKAGLNKSKGAVLQDCCYNFDPASIYAIQGVSGSGKTTLLKLMNHLLPVDGGRILLAGEDIAGLAPQLVRQRVSMLFQTPAFLGDTVIDNLKFAARFSDRKEIDPGRLMEQVQLDASYLPLTAKSLSIGEQQRVCLARTLVTRPEILLLDEPTSALDETTAKVIIDTIRTISKAEGLLTIMVTHRDDHAALAGDTTLELSNGMLLETTP